MSKFPSVLIFPHLPLPSIIKAIWLSSFISGLFLFLSQIKFFYVIYIFVSKFLYIFSKLLLSSSILAFFQFLFKIFISLSTNISYCYFSFFTIFLRILLNLFFFPLLNPVFLILKLSIYLRVYASSDF